MLRGDVTANNSAAIEHDLVGPRRDRKAPDGRQPKSKSASPHDQTTHGTTSPRVANDPMTGRRPPWITSNCDRNRKPRQPKFSTPRVQALAQTQASLGVLTGRQRVRLELNSRARPPHVAHEFARLHTDSVEKGIFVQSHVSLEFPQSWEQSPRDSLRLKRESPKEVRIEAVIVETVCRHRRRFGS